MAVNNGGDPSVWVGDGDARLPHVNLSLDDGAKFPPDRWGGVRDFEGFCSFCSEFLADHEFGELEMD
jgi:hypothetical protein